MANTSEQFLRLLKVQDGVFGALDLHFKLGHILQSDRFPESPITGGSAILSGHTLDLFLQQLQKSGQVGQGIDHVLRFGLLA
eukprot:CAMPEP_0185613414 /NCGR_PEP_ID=MMETSP0436-20130131/26918_1 /TAXON_ID=626734 ORGANISM="Favella taraikaensis, Strain Fe Narragansett Bay" /NCGR_SAMPLE_ID=MMETSP0436 /ASSEMBLY_ACC=CAM_ASM_000390 /LENGTH=81 /DNA_ID=CAMNT_0028247441 /DNA_START=223 /DNA_END=465 /DNA_ORIENTATION=-